MTISNHFYAEALAFILNLTIQSSIICLFSIFLVKCLFRNHPALRYLVCLSGLCCLLLCPAISGWRASSGKIFPSIPFIEIPYTSQPQSFNIELTKDIPELKEAPQLPPNPVILIGTIWSVGFLYQLMRLKQGLEIARSLTKDCVPYQPFGWNKTRESLSNVLGASLPPVYTSMMVDSPIAIGIFRPSIILPHQLADSLSDKQLRQALLHEGTHITQRTRNRRVD